MKYNPWLEKSLITWMKDNRRGLLIAFMVLGPTVFFGGRYFLVSSWAYKNALDISSSAKPVGSILGEPVKPGFWVGGTIRWSGPSGSAHISIPVAGPKGEGVIVGYAEKKDGHWAFETLYLEGPLQSHIDLLHVQSEQSKTYNREDTPDRKTVR